MKWKAKSEASSRRRGRLMVAVYLADTHAPPDTFRDHCSPRVCVCVRVLQVGSEPNWGDDTHSESQCVLMLCSVYKILMTMERGWWDGRGRGRKGIACVWERVCTLKNSFRLSSDSYHMIFRLGVSIHGLNSWIFFNFLRKIIFNIYFKVLVYFLGVLFGLGHWLATPPPCAYTFYLN